MNWNKTSDKMPDEDKIVLCAFLFSWGYEYEACFWNGINWIFSMKELGFCITPDCWCEIESPKFN